MVGAGIVGLTTAWAAVKRRPGERVVVLEKEEGLAFHQTGRNSGVIHSGIYYKPDSLKARTCRAGREALLEFCQEHGIAFELCGKVVVALDESELPALEKIHERALANGAQVEELGPEQLAEVEPHAAGIRALRIPETGIVDYRGMCDVLARLITEAGGEVLCPGDAEIRSRAERLAEGVPLPGSTWQSLLQAAEDAGMPAAAIEAARNAAAEI